MHRIRVILLALAAPLLSACASAGFLFGDDLPATVTIPFERGLQGHILVPITLDGEPGYGLLDNGAFVTAIDRSFAEDRALKDGGMLSAATKMMSGRQLGKHVTLDVGGVTERMAPMVMDMTPMSAAAGKPVLAIVGEELFEHHVVEVDFSSSQLKLHPRVRYAPPPGFTEVKLKSSATAKARMPALLDGQRGEIVLDLGSASAAMVTEGKTLDAWLAEGRPWTAIGSGIERHGEIEGVPAKLMTAKSISFAGFELEDVPANVLPRNFLGSSLVGLGVEALDRFDIIFNVSARTLWLKPRPHYEEPFYHPIIGFTFSEQSDKGILLASVARNSPAERAGLKPGDRVVRIGGKLASSDVLKALTEGQSVEIELLDGASRTLTTGRYY